MKLRSKAGLGSLMLLVVIACGRTENDESNAAGGPAGGSGGSGVAASGGKLGVGGSSLAGAAGQGGSTTVGGASGEGNTANMGGSIDYDAGAGGTAGTDSVALGEGSWDTTLALTVTKPVPNANVKCARARFTLHFSPSGSNLKAISGRDGAVLTGELIRGMPSSPTYSVSQPLPVPTRGDCDLGSIDISNLTLQAWDKTHDGIADEITGSGKASGNFVLGDQGFTVELGFSLQGVPDVTPPSLLLPSNVHPLDGVSLRTTEPVALSSSVTLTNDATGNTSQPLTGYTSSNGAFGTFSSALILPFGSSWKLSATGRDLAGLPFDVAALPPVAVLADPGLFAQDGFEGTPALSLTGGAKIVSSVGTLPAIKGSKSLFVPSGSSATLHVARPSGAGSVRFTAQSLTNVSGASAGALDVEAGVIGGSVRVRPSATSPSALSTSTNDSTWLFAGPTQDVTLALTESGTEIAIRVAPPTCVGFCPPARALLIDDLRVE